MTFKEMWSTQTETQKTILSIAFLNTMASWLGFVVLLCLLINAR